MGTVPLEILKLLSKLSGYDLLLEIDKISRESGIPSGEIEAQINNFKVHGTQVEKPEIFTSDNLVPEQRSAFKGPKYIDQKQNYRMKYDPSSEGIARQSEIKEAIMCESCGSALGIPNIRPIEVKCPNCGNTEFYTV